MKFVASRPYADPEAAMRKILELTNAFAPVQEGRVYIEAINGPMIFQAKATPAEYKAGLNSPSHEACCGCTRAEPMRNSRKLARSCSREANSHVPLKRS